ncbi:MAG TPA: hypothetical protein PK405_07740 [Hyphomicrobiales bacterium]|nr:hypothetical protein [Hyphomicrobiales bacterium]
MNNKTSRPRWVAFVAVIAVAFGALTLFAGGKALFGGDEARAAAGNAVPLVLWFNFLSGFLYILAGIGLFLWQRWGAWLAALIAIGLVVTFALFAWHVAMGGAYEMRTVAAMGVRTAFWLAVAYFAHRRLGRRPA